MGKTERKERKGMNGETGSYVVGQVANSLFQKQAGQCKLTPLMTLFTPASATQPVLTPVPENKVSSKKRKLSKDESDVTNKAKQQKVEKRKPVRVKKLSAAERKLAHREDALSAADEEDEGKQRKNRKQSKEAEEDKVPRAPATRKRKVTNYPLERIKCKRTLFVGNLPSECDKTARAEHTMSRRLATIQKQFHPMRNNMNAYIVFQRDSDAVRALARNGCEIQTGFHMRVDLCSGQNTHDHRKSVFLGNLPYDISEDQVRDHFCQCGEIESVRIVRDRFSGMGKGFGYVLFQSTDAVTLALKLNNSELKERQVRVSRSVRKDSTVTAQRNTRVKARAEKRAPHAKDFVGVMAKPAEGQKTKKKKKGRKSKLSQGKASKSRSKR
ncbi:RNA-binding protein 34 isoform X2 [Mustelus asterias]